MKLLVTGATGFVGAALLQRLSGDALSVVRATVRKADTPLAERVQFVVIPDIGPETVWQDALAGCDTVVHLAARVHIMRDTVSDPLAEFRRINVQGTLNLARQAADAGVRRFVYVSSAKVNGEASVAGLPFGADDKSNPQDNYAISKCEAEAGLWDLLKTYTMTRGGAGMELVIVRPPLVYGAGVGGNFLRLMRAVSRRLPLPLGAIRNQRSFLAIDNLVDLIALCIWHPKAANQTFLVSDGHDLSTPELIRAIAAALGIPARLISVPTAILLLGANLVGRPGTAHRLCGNLQLDISKTRDLLSWVPPTGIDEGLRKTADHFK